jgi:hypothetical protein
MRVVQSELFIPSYAVSCSRILEVAECGVVVHYADDRRMESVRFWLAAFQELTRVWEDWVLRELTFPFRNCI